MSLSTALATVAVLQTLIADSTSVIYTGTAHASLQFRSTGSTPALNVWTGQASMFVDSSSPVLISDPHASTRDRSDQDKSDCALSGTMIYIVIAAAVVFGATVAAAVVRCKRSRSQTYSCDESS